MTDAQKLQLAAATARKELRALALKDDATAEDITAASARVDDLEARAAVLTAAEVAENGPAVVTTEDSEGREVRALEGRVEVRNYIGAAFDGGAVGGAEGEYNAALKIGARDFPLRLLAPEVETRATTDVDGAATQVSWLDRVFAGSAASHIGVTMPSVSPGVSSYPVTTAGPTAAQRGRAEAAADAAWTVGVTEVKPTRNAVRVVFTSEDAARLPGLEQALRRDMRAALVAGIDKAIFVGDSGANEDAGDITGFQTAGIGEVTVKQTDKIKAAKTLEVFVDLIEGLYAGSLGDLRIVSSVGAARLWLKTIAAATVENQTVAQFLMASGLSWMTRADIDTATAAGDFGAFIGLGRGIAGSAVAPVWESARLILDPYSGAARGETALTLQTLWGFAIPRTANYKRLKFVA